MYHIIRECPGIRKCLKKRHIFPNLFLDMRKNLLCALILHLLGKDVGSLVKRNAAVQQHRDLVAERCCFLGSKALLFLCPAHCPPSTC